MSLEGGLVMYIDVGTVTGRFDLVHDSYNLWLTSPPGCSKGIPIQVRNIWR